MIDTEVLGQSLRRGASRHNTPITLDEATALLEKHFGEIEGATSITFTSTSISKMPEAPTGATTVFVMLGPQIDHANSVLLACIMGTEDVTFVVMSRLTSHLE